MLIPQPAQSLKRWLQLKNYNIKVTISKRILFIIPFLIAAYFYLTKQLSDNDCSGLVDVFIFLFQLVCCVVTFIIAVVATIRKRQSEKFKIEPITGAVTFLTLTTIVLAGLYPNLFKGSIYISADSEQFSNIPGGQKLKFRHNKKVEVHKVETDFSCYETFDYKQLDDTFVINKQRDVYERGVIANKFIKQGQKLIPLTENNLIDTSKQSIKFVIVQTR